MTAVEQASTPLVALSIAGSDSGGGAGMQADLRTFAAFGLHGASAVAALTAQSTAAVTGVLATPGPFLVAQVRAVVGDLDVRAVKTGMLATAENVVAVGSLAAAGDLPNLVVDPVMVASTGARLLDADAEHAYLEILLPLALVITPNVHEAAALLGRPVTDLADQRAAAAELAERTGAPWVVVTGGDGGGERSVDVVWGGGTRDELSAPRIATRNTHGSGCTFAAAIAAGLARGAEPARAIADAKAFVTRAIAGGARWRLGAGHGPLDQLGLLDGSPGHIPGVPDAPTLDPSARPTA